MFENIFNDQNETEQKEAEDSRGGCITASYDDAVKFAHNRAMDSVKGVFDGDEPTHPMMMLLKAKDAGTKIATIYATIAFVYGKTEDEVRRDVERA